MASQGFDRKDEGAKDSGAQLREGVAEDLNLAEKASPGALGFAIDSVLDHPGRPNGLSQLTSYTAGGDAAKAWTEYKKLLNPEQLDGIRRQVEHSVSNVDMSLYDFKAGDVIHAIHHDLREDNAEKFDLTRRTNSRNLRELAELLDLLTDDFVDSGLAQGLPELDPNKIDLKSEIDLGLKEILRPPQDNPKE